MHARNRLNRAAVVVAVVLAVAAILAVTMLRSVVEVGGLWNPEAHQQRSLDFVLFDGWSNPTVWYAPWTNTFGNVLLFLPVGLLTVLARDAFAPATRLQPSRSVGRSVLAAAVVGLGFSFFIEVTQFVLALGYSDVDDLLFNTVGAALGGWLGASLGRRGRRLAVLGIAGASLLIVGVMAAGLPHALAHGPATAPTLVSG